MSPMPPLPLRFTAALLFAFTTAVSIASACPMCKDSVPASDAQSAGGLPGGFNSSIYLMLGALFAVLGMVAWTLVKAGRPVPGKLQIPGTRSETNPRSKPGE